MANYYRTVLDNKTDVLCREIGFNTSYIRLSDEHAARVDEILEKYDKATAQSKLQTLYLFLLATGKRERALSYK